jgi:hypothetical protein
MPAFAYDFDVVLGNVLRENGLAGEGEIKAREVAATLQLNPPQPCNHGAGCNYNGPCAFVHAGEEGTGLKYFPERERTDPNTGEVFVQRAAIRMVNTDGSSPGFYERRRLTKSWAQWCSMKKIPYTANRPKDSAEKSTGAAGAAAPAPKPSSGKRTYATAVTSPAAQRAPPTPSMQASSGAQPPANYAGMGYGGYGQGMGYGGYGQGMGYGGYGQGTGFYPANGQQMPAYTPRQQHGMMSRGGGYEPVMGAPPAMTPEMMAHMNAYFQLQQQQAYAQQQEAYAQQQRQQMLQMQQQRAAGAAPSQRSQVVKAHQEQKDKMGEDIYPKVVKTLADLKEGMVKNGSWPTAIKEDSLAGRVTGMLLELDAEEVAKLSSDTDELSDWVLRACDVLSSHK